MNVAAMGQRLSNHDRAIREQRRRRVERTLACSCGARNKPGAVVIEIDEYDTAWCQTCGTNWSVHCD